MPNSNEPLKGDIAADMLRILAWISMIAGMIVAGYYLKTSPYQNWPMALYAIFSGLLSFLIMGALATLLRHVIYIRKNLPPTLDTEESA